MAKFSGRGNGTRSNALWGSGGHGKDTRTNALWGKGGRGFVTTVFVIALAVPLAAGAGSGSGKNDGVIAPGATYVSAQLKQAQKKTPDAMVSVIVQMDETVTGKDAEQAG